MSHRSRIQDVKEKVIKEFVHRGYVVQLYESHSSNSVYIKLDYGLCNTIRISDHEGYGYLKYKFNVILNLKDAYRTKDRYGVRFFYGDNMMRALFHQISKVHNEKMLKYGCSREKYIAAMEEMRDRNKDSKGFWQYSQLIQDIPEAVWQKKMLRQEQKERGFK
jgi:hypothetical protein